MDYLINIISRKDGKQQQHTNTVQAEESNLNDGKDKHFQDDKHTISTSTGQPRRTVTHKLEIPDMELEESRGTETIESVKQHISQVLVSKYVRNDETLVGADVYKTDSERNSVESVKQKISKMLMEKYAHKQKSKSLERNGGPTDSYIPEKSSPAVEIHVDSCSSEDNPSETVLKTEDSMNAIETVIEGYSLKDFEGDLENWNENTQENDETTDSETPDFSRTKVGFAACKDKVLVNGILNSVETSNSELLNSLLPHEQIGEHVTFQEVDGFSLEENHVTADNISKEQVITECDIKPELLERENPSAKAVSGPAAKVTLDLSTISKLTNIWGKTYGSDKKPKKSTVQNTEETSVQMFEANIYMNEGISSHQNDFAPLETSNENVTNNENGPEANIENLQISESLKLKLMNRKQFGKVRRPYLKKTNATLSKEACRGTEQQNNHSSELTSQRRKVGRPKAVDKAKNYLTRNGGAQTELGVEAKVWKSKVGHPKRLKVKELIPEDRRSLTEVEQVKLNPQSDTLTTVRQNQTDNTAFCSENLHSNVTTDTVIQKRKVGRLPKSVTHKDIKRTEKDIGANFNLKPCFVRLINVDSQIKCLEQNGKYLGKTLDAKQEHSAVPTKTSHKIMKLKPGRPKKSVEIGVNSKLSNRPASDEALKTSVNLLAIESVKNVENSLSKKPALTVFNRKPGRPAKILKSVNTPKAIKSLLHLNSQGTTEIKAKAGRPKKKHCSQGTVNTNQTDVNVGKEKTNKSTLDVVFVENMGQSNHSRIKSKQEKGCENADADEWEDDWLSDEMEEGDSSDDYFPSEDEYKPNKNEVLKNIFSSNKTKKRYVKQDNSEINCGSATDNINSLRDHEEINPSSNQSIEKSKPTNKEVKRETKDKVRKYRRHKHTGPRIGRPPVIGEYHCKDCSFTTYEKNLVQKHYNEVHRKEWMQCQFCDFKTRSKNMLLEHEGKIHTNSKPFKCDFEGCSYASNVHTDYQRHRSQKHAAEKTFKCTRCDYSTRWKRNLSNHSQTVHNDVRAFVCDICNFAFKRKQDLKGHMIWHSDEKPLQCDTCGFRCKTNWEIKSHKLSHSDIRPFPCTHPGCKQACKTKSDLTKHMVVHETVRKYQCSLCPRKYKSYYAMKKHERGPLHSTERRFQCDKCEKAFKTKQSLAKHDLLHKGIRPFKCDCCGKEHITRHNLETHKLTHRLDERPFHCPICPFGTKLPGALLAHIGAAHGDSYAYYCELCKKPFKRYSQLQMHYRRCHTEEDRKKLGNAFEVDLALMKMEMELDLEDTFESMGFSSNKKARSKVGKSSINIKMEPFDKEYNEIEQDMNSDSDFPPEEEFEAMERELNSDSELPPDIRGVKKAKIRISKVLNKSNMPKKRGRPKKNKSFENKGSREIVTTLQESLDAGSVSEKVSEISTSAANEFRMIAGCSENIADHDMEAEANAVSERNPDPHSHNCISEMSASDKNETCTVSVTQMGLLSDLNEILKPESEQSNTDRILDFVSEQINKGKTQELEISEVHEPDSVKQAETDRVTAVGFQPEENVRGKISDTCVKDSDRLESVNHTETIALIASEREKEQDYTGFIKLTSKAEWSLEKPVVKQMNMSNSHLQLKTNAKEGLTEISPLITVSNSVESENQTPAADSLSESFTNIVQGKDLSTGHKSNIMNMQEGTSHSKSSNPPKPFFFNKLGGKLSATLAIYDGFRLPLATKGFHFNYEKRGKKTKSWFMDPSCMDNKAREHHMKYLQRMRLAANLHRKRRTFEGRMPKLTVPQNLSEFVKDRRRKVNYYRNKRKMAEGVKLTDEELKEMKNTLVFERQKRKASFQGSYSEFENLEGEDLTVSQVQQLFPLGNENKNEIPIKKQKMFNLNKKEATSKKKIGKCSRQKKNTKPVLLYSERKKPPKKISIRKPEFIDKQKNETEESNIENLSGSKATSLLPQERKDLRKQKGSAEKKVRKNAKDQYEPAQLKYRYIKRSQQKKKSSEDMPNNESLSTCITDFSKHKLDSAKVTRQTCNAGFSSGKIEKANAKGVTAKANKKMNIRITKPQKQTKHDRNTELRFQAAGMFREAICNCNLIRVHPPSDVHYTANENKSSPATFYQQTDHANVDIRNVIQGGKCLMYCDDVVVMKDLGSSQEIFGLSIDQIKSETFIEPVEPYSTNKVFNNGAVVNSAHPILLTQDCSDVEIRETHLISDNRNNEQRLVSRTTESQGIETSENLQVHKEMIEVGTGEMNSKQVGRLLIKESSTDREVLQLDYSIVKEEPENGEN